MQHILLDAYAMNLTARLHFVRRAVFLSSMQTLAIHHCCCMVHGACSTPDATDIFYETAKMDTDVLQLYSL
jgi:hypothetical protein